MSECGLELHPWITHNINNLLEGLRASFFFFNQTLLCSPVVINILFNPRNISLKHLNFLIFIFSGIGQHALEVEQYKAQLQKANTENAELKEQVKNLKSENEKHTQQFVEMSATIQHLMVDLQKER